MGLAMAWGVWVGTGEEALGAGAPSTVGLRGVKGSGMLSPSPVAETRVAVGLADWTGVAIAMVVPIAGELTRIG